MSAEQQAPAGAERRPVSPKLKPMEQWEVGPLWAWVAGAVVVVVVFIFACSAMYNSAHPEGPAAPTAAASSQAQDTDNIPTGPRTGAPATATTRVGATPPGRHTD